VGVDLSLVHIEQARHRVEALALNNVELLHADIARLELDALGEFDFIVCHGVYSWVPPHVQDAILAACGRLLAANGVAYVGYNTYPGWKAREIVRDAMLLNVGDSATADEKVSRARAMVDFLQKVAQPGTVLSRAVDDYRRTAPGAGDYYVLHEELELYNLPCYFTDFVARARSHGLDYLAEAQPEYSFATNYGPVVAEHVLEHADDQVLLEQHLDFAVNRHYRQSLLVRAGSAMQIRRTLDRSRLRRMHFAMSSAMLPDWAQFDEGQKAAVDALTDQWPWTLSWPQIVEAARNRLSGAGASPTPDLEAQIDALIEGIVVQGLGRYRLDPVSPEPSCTPIRLAEPIRRMARLTRDDTDAFVFNHWHEQLPLSPVDRYLLPLLDGSRDRDGLLAVLLDVAGQGLIHIEREDGQERDADAIRDVLAQWVDALPQRLEEMKLTSVRSISLRANGCASVTACTAPAHG
jgi:methyltransferase-like protein